ncbi:hypothetical protein GCM10010465_10350 [Actinomadura fibrosa]
MLVLPALFLFIFLFSSCAAHKRSHIIADEEFVLELKRPSTRGGAIDIALQGLFLGANYLAEKSSEALTSSYSQDLSIKDYYNTDLGKVEKTYSEIHIKKYSKPTSQEKNQELEQTIRTEVSSVPKSRGSQQAFLAMDEIIRPVKEDLLNFHAVIELISDEENPGITRLSFNELRVFFSKTKVFSDEDLNARVSILIKGQWRGEDGTPITDTLIEQEYDFKDLKYGPENQIQTPILSPWYYDIPIYPDVNGNESYGVVQISVQLEEYEGNRSKYINQLPSILSKNKNSIIKSGSSTIKKIVE